MIGPRTLALNETPTPHAHAQNIMNVLVDVLMKDLVELVVEEVTRYLTSKESQHPSYKATMGRTLRARLIEWSKVKFPFSMNEECVISRLLFCSIEQTVTSLPASNPETLTAGQFAEMIWELAQVGGHVIGQIGAPASSCKTFEAMLPAVLGQMNLIWGPTAATSKYNLKSRWVGCLVVALHTRGVSIVPWIKEGWSPRPSRASRRVTIKYWVQIAHKSNSQFTDGASEPAQAELHRARVIAEEVVRESPDAPWKVHTLPIEELPEFVWRKENFPTDAIAKKPQIGQSDNETKALFEKIWTDRLVMSDVRIRVGVLFGAILSRRLPNIALSPKETTFHMLLEDCLTPNHKKGFFTRMTFADGGQQGMKQVDAWFAAWMAFWVIHTDAEMVRRLWLEGGGAGVAYKKLLSRFGATHLHFILFSSSLLSFLQRQRRSALSGSSNLTLSPTPTKLGQRQFLGLVLTT